MKCDEIADLYTAAGERLYNSPEEIPWNEYPRPQLRRNSFFCLNGWWDFMVTEGDAPCDYSERIRVPFSPESLLSGVHRVPPIGAHLYYRRTFSLPPAFIKTRVLLHCGAADQVAQVWLNGQLMTEHTGGYWPFSVDITDALSEKNTLVIAVTDRLENHILPYGKQRRDRGGMWYTPVSGLWQTVWLESVAQDYIKALRIDADDTAVHFHLDGASSGSITVHTPEGDVLCPVENGTACFIPASPQLWSPEQPYLYYCTIQAGDDVVTSYFAMRRVDVRVIDGVQRICLNGKPIFLHALLDQGYWSDGLFLPAQPDGFEADVRTAQDLGYNTLRKHIKIEPEQFYYACDRCGILVWQDMVNNGDYCFWRDTALPTIGLKRLSDRRLHRHKQTRQAFEQAMTRTVIQLYNHPCIIGWTIFNEGWGQFDSTRMYHHLREMDASRLIDTASGWFSGGESDVNSPHIYFKPVCIKAADKPVFLSEFGGYSYKVKAHSFNVDKAFGYKFFTQQSSFEQALISLYQKEIIPAVAKGLCGAVYTQLADVEDETNGLITYDRRVIKVDAMRMKHIAEQLKIGKKYPVL